MRKKRHAKWLVAILMVAGLMFPTLALAEEVTGATGTTSIEADSGASDTVSTSQLQGSAVTNEVPSTASVTQSQAAEPAAVTETLGGMNEDPTVSADADDAVDAVVNADDPGEPAGNPAQASVEPMVAPEEDVQAQGEDSSAGPTRAPTRAEQAGVITKIEAQLADGSGPVGDVGQWQVFRLNAEFALPDGQVHAGDTTTITLPDELKFNQMAGFAIEDTAGNVVANAVIDGAAKTITLTYTDYPENHSDVSGSFYFYVQIDRNEVDEARDIPLEFTVSGETVIGSTIHFTGIGEATPHYMNKSGYQVGTDGRTLRFQVAVNTIQQAIQNVVITDRLDASGVTIDPATIRIYKGTWKRVPGDWNLVDRQDVTADYTVTVSDDGTSFTVELGDIAATDGFLIYYDAIASYDFADGEIVRNKATMVGNDTELTTVVATATYYEAGGSAEGYVFTIKVKKVGEDGSPLAGARFDVIRVSNGATVGSITTDANGEGSLSGLLKDTYQLVETTAPVGYTLLTTPVEVNSSDFGADKVATVTVENKLEKTSFTVAKTWIGPGTGSVTVRLTADGVEIDSLELSADNSWTATFENLPVYDVSDGHAIVYDVNEDPVPGYENVKVHNSANDVTFTNTNTQTIDIPVTKTWVGASAGSVTIRLLADGVEVGVIELDESSGWTATFEGLLKYDGTDGHEVVYTITEDPVSGYTSVISGDTSNGFVIINTADTPPEPDKPSPPAVTTGKKPSTPGMGGFSKPGKSGASGLAKTGDGIQAFTVSAVLLAVALTLIAIAIVRRRKGDES